jgi:hypothetical protein
MHPIIPPPEKAKRVVGKESIRNSTVSGRMPSVEAAENASDKKKC